MKLKRTCLYQNAYIANNVCVQFSLEFRVMCQKGIDQLTSMTFALN